MLIAKAKMNIAVQTTPIIGFVTPIVSTGGWNGHTRALQGGKREKPLTLPNKRHISRVSKMVEPLDESQWISAQHYEILRISCGLP